MDEADPANIEGLLANAYIVAARAGIGVTDGADQGRKRDRIIGKLLGIDIDVVFLGESAEPRNVEHAINGAKLLLDYPVFDFLFMDQIMIGPFHRIAVDFADRIFGRNSRNDPGGQSYETQPIDGFDPIPVVVAVPRKVAANVRQPEQRNGTHRLEVAHPAQTVLG